MPLSLAAIERIKLGATMCNTLCTGLITVGVFAPIVYRLTTMETVPAERFTFLYIVMGLCVLGALILHLTGQGILKFLELDDDGQ